MERDEWILSKKRFCFWLRNVVMFHRLTFNFFFFFLNNFEGEREHTNPFANHKIFIPRRQKKATKENFSWGKKQKNNLRGIIIFSFIWFDFVFLFYALSQSMKVIQSKETNEITEQEADDDDDDVYGKCDRK